MTDIAVDVGQDLGLGHDRDPNALDDAFLKEETAEARFRKACENIPSNRVERLMSSANSALSRIRMACDWQGVISEAVETAEARMNCAIGAIRAAEKACGTLKSGAAAAHLASVLESVTKTLQGDSGGNGQSLRSLIAQVRHAASLCGSVDRREWKSDVDNARKAFKGVEGVNRALHTVLVAELPRAAEEAVPAGSLLDNETWASLMVGLKKALPAEKPALLAFAMRRLSEDLDRAVRQIGKMKARTLASGATEAEQAAANRKSVALKASVLVMRRRMVALAAAFYRYRARQLASLEEATLVARDALRSDAVSAETLGSAKEFLHRHGIQRSVDGMLCADASLEAGKGRNPTLANLMRKFKDNYVERITANGKADHA